MFSLSAMDLVPSQAIRREWLMANGLGGYSSSTTIGMNSRKYHGLLVAPTKGTHDRYVFLAKVEDSASVGSTEFQLSTNSYPGAVYPTGYRHQVGFKFHTHPVFSYSLGAARLEKSVRLLAGKNTVLVSYRLASGGEANLAVKPLLSLRPIHADPSSCEAQFEHDRAGFSISKPAKMRMSCSLGKFTPKPEKYFNMVYELEKERGYPCTETLFCPGSFTATISRGEELHLSASLESMPPSEALELFDRQAFRLNHLADSYARQSGLERTDFSDSLVLAADSFIIRGQRHKGVIAGYHWFSEWARDTMISLPGLLLTTGRAGLAREILQQAAATMKEGLLPNFIDEGGTPHYNSSDASLWFINAVREYALATGDYQFIRSRLWKAMRAWLSSCIRGNSLLSMGSDCLLEVHSPASTWMDAQAGGKPVTPRVGKPVEINALWHSNLRFMGMLAGEFGDRRTEGLCSQVAEQAASSFQKFLSADGGLLDVIEPNDASVRPNQIFAVSLPFSPLNSLQQKHVFNIVRSQLYTPLGLRTLAPSDPRCRSSYSGSPSERDSAYHQGMIWPWLLGAFYDAQLKVYPGSEHQVLSSLKPLADKMSEGCIGSLPEIYEPATGRPAGAVSQAWSVAEILRIYAKVKKTAAQRRQEAQYWVQEKELQRA